MTDPTVTIDGGTFSAVDTARIDGQRRELLRVAAALRAVADRCALARFAVGAGPFDGFGAGPLVTGALGAGTLAVPTLGGFGARGSGAGPAVLDALKVCASAATEVADDVECIADRMRCAAAMYDDGGGAATEAVRASAVLGSGLGPGGFLLPVALGVVSGAAAVVVHGLGTGRWEPGRMVTSTAGVHEALVAGPLVALGVLDVHRAPGHLPTGGNAANVLRGMLHVVGPDVASSVRVRREPTAALGPPRSAPHTVADVFDGIDAPGGGSLPPSSIGIQRIRHDDGTATWLVTIPGTQSGVPGTVFDMDSNFALMSDDPVTRRSAASARGVVAAMEAANIPSGEDVVLAGHSQGGMVAAVVAASTVGRFRVVHVATMGSPVGRHSLPGGVRGTHVEVRGEGVSDLDGRPNPVSARRVTVVGRYAATGAVPHGIAYHQRVLAVARDVGHKGLDDNLRDVERRLDGTVEVSEVYRLERGAGGPGAGRSDQSQARHSETARPSQLPAFHSEPG